MKLRALLLLLALPASAYPISPDDGAASIAAGGIVLFDREPNIVMAKEVLQISATKVVVDYDFRNDTDQDISTVVAFPIPAYDFGENEIAPASEAFDNFHVWIDDAPATFQTDTRAFVKSKDVTQELVVMHIDIASLGQLDASSHSAELERLSAVQRRRLKQAGILDQDGMPAWSVHKKYYWQQTFPAKKTVHIRHEYVPVLGSTNSIKYGLGSSSDLQAEGELKSMCVNDRLQSVLRKVAASNKRDAPYSYIDFILTSANTWKRPIEDFTLIVERPHPKGSSAEYVSFCWDGPVSKPDADHFVASGRNFIPKKELRVGFFDVRDSAS